jgi:hypothetical protein
MSNDNLIGNSVRHRKLTILLIATRDLRGRMTGRKAVLQTTVNSLVKLGHHVVVAYFGAGADDGVVGASDDQNHVRYLKVHGPHLWEVLVQLVSGFLVGRRSLNECLYTSRRARTALARFVHAEKVDVVVTDMVRTATYGELLGLPWISDLDDLLSLRYKRIAKERRGLDGLLGYHKTRGLQVLAGLVRPVLETVLRWESTIIARREIAVAQRADLTLAVSAVEAAILGSLSSRPVFTTPISMTGPRQIAPFKDRPRDLVFLGAFSYQPNRDAVRTFDERILRQLGRFGLDDICLHVVGEDGTGYEFSSNIRFMGYAKELNAELQKYKAMLVPEVLQGGIKTKVVHAALNKVIVLAHDTAVAGMGMEPGVNVLTWRSPEDLAVLLRRVRGNDPGLAVIADNALGWAVTNFGEQRAEAKWKDYLSSLFRESDDGVGAKDEVLVGGTS